MSFTIDVNAYENAWLGLSDEDLKQAKTPLSGLTDQEKNDFHLHILKKMRDPPHLSKDIKIKIKLLLG